jgi:hypothetical protein
MTKNLKKFTAEKIKYFWNKKIAIYLSGLERSFPESISG